MLCKTLFIALLMFFLFVVIGGCHRHKQGCFRHHTSHKKKLNWIFKKISKELKLNDSQKIKFEKIKNDIETKHEELKGTKTEMLNVFLTQLESNEVNVSELNKEFDEKHQHIQEMKSFLIDKFAEFHSILTPEQRTKLAEKIKKYHKKTDSVGTYN